MKGDLALGVTLATKERGGVLGIDVDGIKLSRVVVSVKKLQTVCALGSADIIQSSAEDHFHVVFFDNWLEWGKIIGILRVCEIVDPQFVEAKDELGYLRLRAPPEAKLIQRIDSDFPGLGRYEAIERQYWDGVEHSEKYIKALET